jgi:histidinol-phosphatase
MQSGRVADDELLQAAIEIVAEASILASQLFFADVPVRSKADGSPVTAADIEVERLIRSRIASRFPEDGVLGEEDGETPGRSGRRWIIDPIDGTTYFTRRIPTFEVLLAVEDDGARGSSFITRRRGRRNCWRYCTARSFSCRI